MAPFEELQNKFDRLAQNGIIVSICYGSLGNEGIHWTINVLTKDFKEFHHPFLANNLEHCLDIAIQECSERGWLKEKS